MQYSSTKLQRALAKRGITKLELSRRAKRSPSTITELFQTGRAHPETVRSVARILRVSLAELVDEQDDEQQEQSA